MPGARDLLPRLVRKTPLRRYAAAAVLLLLGVLVLAYHLIGEALTRHQAEVETEIRREAMLRVEVHAQLVHRLLDHVDTIHSLTAEAFGATAATGEEAGGFLRQQLEALGRQAGRGLLQVAVMDAQGRLEWSTAQPAGAADLSDQEHLRRHAEGHRGPLVSAPLADTADGRRSLRLTRPILDREGRLRGVSVVAVDPALISNDLALAPMRKSGRILLVRNDGFILASGEKTDGWAGQQLGGANLRRILAASDGVELVQGSRTGRTRIAAWRQAGEWPVFVVHSLPRELAAEEARRRAAPERFMLLSGLVAFWCLVVAAGMLVYAIAARQAARYAHQARVETDQTLAALPGAAYRLDFGATGEMDWRPVAPAIAAALEGRAPGAGDIAIEDLLDREARATRAEFAHRLRETGEAICEYNAIAPGGKLRRLREHARLFATGEAGRLQVAGLLADVTTQRDLEARLAAAARMSTLGDMASGIAHEVNQPATAIALGVDIALLHLQRLDPAAAGPLRDRLEEVAQQAIRLRDVIAHFRAFSRPDQEHGPLGLVRLDVAIEGLRRIVDGMLHTAGVTLRVDVPENLPPIRCRLVPLEQALLNLVVNARDAVLREPEASRIIELSARFDAPRHAVMVTVRDHGPGFPDDVLPHVFEPFFTTKGPEHGTGLGLSIVHATMKNFHGDVAVRNHSLGGAEVILIFPLDAVEEAEAPPLHQKESLHG